MRLVSLVSLLFCLSACCVQRLAVYTDYIGPQTLASAQIGTPDPLALHPPTGQRLIVKWHVPHTYMEHEDLHLSIALRFRDRSTQNLTVPVEHTAGTYLYEVLGDTYCQTRGILSYQVQLLGDGEILEEWLHPLWTSIIELNSSKTSL